MEGTVKEKKYSVKTFLCDAALLIFALLCICVVIQDCKATWILSGMDQSLTKLFAFFAIDVLLARISYRAVKDCEWKTQLSVVIAGAIAVTVFSVLLNNVWHYIYMLWNFDWLKPLSFWWVVREDITYLYGLGFYRYAIVCLGYVLSFLVLKKRIFNKVKEFLCNMR